MSDLPEHDAQAVDGENAGRGDADAGNDAAARQDSGAAAAGTGEAKPMETTGGPTTDQAAPSDNASTDDKPVDPKEKARKDAIFQREFLPQLDALYNFGYHLTYNAADANDLVQETFLKAYRFIDSYKEGTNAKAWLFRILKNAFINQYRKRSRQPQQVDYEDFTHYQEGDNRGYNNVLDLREELFQNMMGDEIQKALNSLPMDFRTPVLLCDVEGFTYEEIAEVMEIPIGTVRSRLHRARNMLKDQLREYAKQHGFKEKR
jgi:RNA polymerase sigma-70 factor (ECF subfamily)